MADPFSFLPLALAAHGGRVDDVPAEQLVAAGIALLQRSATLVRTLSGKRSAILLPTSHRFLVALAASDGRGAVLINPLAAQPEIAHQLRDANVGAVFTNAALARHLPDDVTHVLLDDAPKSAIVISNRTRKTVDLGSHFGLSLEGEPDTPGADEEAAIVYTSAMAGTPLGAIVTHRNLLANARSTIEAMGNTSDDRVLALLPFAHLFGLTVTASGPLMAGARVTTMAKFSPSRAIELISSGQITEIVGVPSVYRALISAIEQRSLAADDVRGALRVCICGGSPLPPSLQERWFEATGVELRQGYGLTEAGPVCLFNRVDRPNIRGSLGAPLPRVEVRLGEQHEILVRGDNVFRGYVSGGERGLQLTDGWLHTGDIGRREKSDSIGFLMVEKEMFTRNGFNIYPRELERVIGEMTGIEQVRVSAAEHPEREPDIVVAIRGRATSDEVRAWCATRLSAYKQPQVVDCVDNFERLSN
ncbi:MAG TPA: AMP-binding protein [Gemmatimonadaceae bacterium]|jgi:long-chain acyl-CoA synthetase